MENSFMPVNRLLYRAIAAGDGMPPLSSEQEATVISHSSRLSFRFMRDAIRHAGVCTLGAMVYVAQGSACTLLNYLHRRLLRDGTSHFRTRIGKSFCGFLEYLWKDFHAYFRHDDLMPVLLWLPVADDHRRRQ